MIAKADRMEQDLNPGIACRRCGCSHVPAYKSVDVRSRTMRYRECRNCGARFTTYEAFGRDVVGRVPPPGNQAPK